MMLRVVRVVRVVTLVSVCNCLRAVNAGGARVVRAVIAQIIEIIAGGKTKMRQRARLYTTYIPGALLGDAPRPVSDDVVK